MSRAFGPGFSMRLYLDTSVIGGNFDPEFREWTTPLIDEILIGKHIAVISDLTIREAQAAPGKVRMLLEKLLDSNCEFIKLNAETETLASQYMKEGSLSPKLLEDANHIAMASFYRANAVVSWNFKHIVNVERIRLFNSVNLKYGYDLIDIRSPREITGI